MSLRLVIADDHPLVLAGLRTALATEEGIDVVGVADSGEAALRLVALERPDMALLDLHMPDVPGLQCLAEIRERYPGVMVVVLSGSREQADVDRALAAGAAAYLDKRVRLEDLGAVLRQVRQGTVHQPLAPADPLSDAGLTARERDVLEAMLLGRSNKAIGAELWVTERTVKFHLGNIYRKLGVSTRAEAQHLAYERGVAVAR